MGSGQMLFKCILYVFRDFKNWHMQLCVAGDVFIGVHLSLASETNLQKLF